MSNTPPLADMPPGPTGEVIRMVTLPEVSASADTAPFSSISEFRSIASICTTSIPGWKAIIADSVSEKVEVKQLLEGLSNQLFKVSIKNTKDLPTIPYSTVLFRIYGEHVSSFYDPGFELEVFRMLSTMNIGPQMIANGSGWRIEEFHESVVLPVSSLPNPSILCQVASQLGRLHKIHRLPKFPPTFDRTPISVPRLDRWTREGLAALERLPDRTRIVMDGILPEIDRMSKLLHTPPTGDSLGWDVVFCHNDVQENNILLTPYGIRLIDFEYANFNFQFADVGNFFNEFTMDYLHSEHPIFKGTPEAYPSLELRRLFATVYLSEYMDRPVTDVAVLDGFLATAEIGAQLSHLLWGLWSLVRAQQNASTFGSFDFIEYANFRFASYMKRKDALGWT